jgi:hypothetical protein
MCSGQPVASSSSCRRARPIGMRASRRSVHRVAKATSSRYPNDVSRRIAARIWEEAAPFAASIFSICADVRSLRASARTASCNHRSGDGTALSVTRLLTSLEQDRCLVCLVCLVFWLNETNQMNQINKTNQIDLFRRRLCVVAAPRVSLRSFFRPSSAPQRTFPAYAPADRPGHAASLQSHVPTAGCS